MTVFACVPCMDARAKNTVALKKGKREEGGDEKGGK